MTLKHFTPLEVISGFEAEENMYVLHIIYTCRSTSVTITLSREQRTYRWASQTDLETLSSSMYVALELEALKALS